MKKRILFFTILVLTVAFMHPHSGAYANDLTKIKNEYEKFFPTDKAASKNIAWLDLDRISYSDDVINASKDIRDNFENVVLFGIGGSSLGAEALQWSLAHGSLYNNLPKQIRNGPKFFFAGNNASPETINNLLKIIHPKNTLLIVVSKSGTTAETIGSFLPVFDLFKKSLGQKNVGNHVVAITGHSEKSILRKMDKAYRFRYLFNIEDGVGGRFSVLSPVGLLPAAILGIDVRELLRGASNARDTTLNDRKHSDISSIIATKAIEAMSENKNIIVFFPFDERLTVFSKWFRQLWAESLGKTRKDGKRVGSTPLALIGSTDNHSVQQLILDGPRDKFVILIGVKENPNDIKIETLHSKQYKNISYLNNIGLSELLIIMADATEKTYRNNHIPYYRFDLPKINAYNIGQMITHLELATSFTGELLGINPYNQPAVSAGKKYVKEMIHDRED